MSVTATFNFDTTAIVIRVTLQKHMTLCTPSPHLPWFLKPYRFGSVKKSCFWRSLVSFPNIYYYFFFFNNLSNCSIAILYFVLVKLFLKTSSNGTNLSTNVCMNCQYLFFHVLAVNQLSFGGQTVSVHLSVSACLFVSLFTASSAIHYIKALTAAESYPTTV